MVWHGLELMRVYFTRFIGCIWYGLVVYDMVKGQSLRFLDFLRRYYKKIGG